MLGQPGSPDLDLGGGGGSSTGGDPNFGTIKPGEQADTTPVTDGRERDAFDRQQDPLEPSADDSGNGDAGEGAGSVLVARRDLRPVDADQLRGETVDLG